MKKLTVFILFTSFLFAKTCIIAYSANKIPDFQKERFLTLFPDNSIIEKQKHYEVLKLGPFMNIKESKQFLHTVRKYYKDAFIVNCTNPIRKHKKTNPKINHKTTNFETDKLTPCRLKTNQCKNSHKNYAWEINQSTIEKNIKLNIKPIIASIEENTTQEANKTNKTCIDSFLRFYTNGGITYALGQKPLNNSQLRGDFENIKIGLQYGCFANYWKFYTDDRLIFYRKHKNNFNKTGIDIDIKELYFQTYKLFENRLNFLLGRKELFDTRSWWIDRPMDTFGIFNLNDLLHYEIYVGGRLNNRTLLSDTTSLTSNLKHTRFLLVHIDYLWHYLEHIGIFTLKEKTTIPSMKRNLNWIGARAFGDKYINENDKIRYWLDIAHNNGKYNSKNTNGVAYEIGALYIKNSYSFGASYASANKEYYQPIFADNKSKFLQRNIKFRYYGEFLDPELSNISILSLYGFYNPSIKDTYVIALHNYKQINTSYPLQTTEYVLKTNGKNKNIGNEIDFIYQYLLSLRYNYKLILAYFKGSDAFNKVADKKDGIYAKFDFTYYW